MKLLSPKVGFWTSVWQATPFTHHHESEFLLQHTDCPMPVVINTAVTVHQLHKTVSIYSTGTVTDAQCGRG